MSIKDTAGIKLYLEDQGKAEIRALNLKSSITDKDSTSYKIAKDLFDEAAGTGNGWANGIVFDAKTKREVNVSVDDYEKSRVSKAIKSFLNFDPGISSKSEREVFDPVSAIAVVTFAVNTVKTIEDLHNGYVERSIKTLEQELNKARWTSFESITPQSIAEKYNK
ncbi:hypothetical protein NP603_08010 [Methylomonas sp. SURF-1]|uniref:DUF4376 domain-containing protein n=1 Tax=Methylomonas aurea TaxID=2952224 RepID=A0ABT1UFP9_9GAMM|nr:hypothetical protein [Methylomonas sp. SURF-1]MCQ8181048.1 hypothetical protein [Methylomonas sp. SURF-1]